MFQIPQIPGWDAMHPSVVHFPIALLLFAPILIIIGLLYKDKGKYFFRAALILMVFGTIGAFVAVGAGEAAAKLAERNPQVSPVLENHQEMAELARNIFMALTVIYALILILPGILRKELNFKAMLSVQALFLVVYLFGMLALGNTAHLGGRLVHEFGLRAML